MTDPRSVDDRLLVTVDSNLDGSFSGKVRDYAQDGKAVCACSHHHRTWLAAHRCGVRMERKERLRREAQSE